MTALRRILALAATLPLAAAAAEPVGAETCKACHPVAWEIWRAGPHARARESLPERNRADSRCVGCHAPVERSAGVTCEACHGNGQLYARRYVMRDRELAEALGLVAAPAERSCLACHDESAPSLGRFDPARKLPLVRHGEADREARRAAAQP